MEQTEHGAWLVLRLHMKSPQAAMQAMQKFAKRDRLNAFKAQEPLVWELFTDHANPVLIGTAQIIPRGEQGA